MKKLVILMICVLAAATSYAVTDKEMDQARAIAAKLYLRWANDGSGYLDEVHPTSMSELNAKLKAKEKENLAAFNAVKVPGSAEYSNWDKAKLKEYWSVTFFKSPGLDEKGKRGKGRVAIEIGKMTVSAPQPKEETPKADPKPEETSASVAGDTTAIDAVPETPVNSEEILNDQQAISDDAAAAETPRAPQEQTHTWVYILVLAILVGVVIWLVVYAANLMKRQPGSEESENKGERRDDESELREQTRKAIAKKNEEVEDLRARLQAEEERSARLGMEIEKIKLERKRQDDAMSRLREENQQLRDASAAAVVTPRPQARPAAAPAAENEQQKKEEAPILKVIYLARANSRGIFVRADRRINPGNTIYRLDTNDGLVGTFHVVDEPEVVEVAISDPKEYLGNGCTCEDLDDTAGVTRIVTESAGTAIFENGYWKILRKTRIRYE